MSPIERSFAVTLTIPDNEAFTARETLQRLGIACADARRATIWTFVVEAAAAPALAAGVAACETIFNPNKHELRARALSRPDEGEVWIAPLAEMPVQLAGEAPAGVRAAYRRTAWRLLDTGGRDVAPLELDRAVETFLCNPAFEKAIR